MSDPIATAHERWAKLLAEVESCVTDSDSKLQELAKSLAANPDSQATMEALQSEATTLARLFHAQQLLKELVNEP